MLNFPMLLHFVRVEDHQVIFACLNHQRCDLIFVNCVVRLVGAYVKLNEDILLIEVYPVYVLYFDAIEVLMELLV